MMINPIMFISVATLWRCSCSAVGGVLAAALPGGTEPPKKVIFKPNKEGKKPIPADMCTPPPAAPLQKPAPGTVPARGAAGASARCAAGRGGTEVAAGSAAGGVAATRGSEVAPPTSYSGISLLCSMPPLHTGHALDLASHVYRQGQQYKWPQGVTTGELAASIHILH